MKMCYLHFTCYIQCQEIPPVEAATAPMRTGGIPSMAMTMAAAQQVNWSVCDEEADSVLWWKL